MILEPQKLKSVTVASTTVGLGSIFKVLLAAELPPSPRYTKKEDQWALNEGGIKEKEGWWKLPDQRVFVSSNIEIQLVKQHPEKTHLGKTAGELTELLLSRF